MKTKSGNRNYVKPQNRKEVFKFWKENRVDQEYQLTVTELKDKYLAYLQTKEESWITYYGHQTVLSFVAADDGLKSVSENLNELQELLSGVRHQLPCYK